MVKLFFVYPLWQASPRLWDYMGVDGLMVSADDLGRVGFKAYSRLDGFDGLLLLDSGGYRLISRSIELDPGMVIRWQGMIEADFIVPLDYPIGREMPWSEAKARIDKSIENVSLWLDRFGRDRVIPVLHGRTIGEIEYSLTMLKELYGNIFSYVGIGSIAEVARYTPDKLASYAYYVRRMLSNHRIHGFGCGASSAVLLSTIGFDSVDTASHLINSRYGMVRHPLTLEMCIVTSYTRSRQSKPAITLDELFRLCECPACSMRDRSITSWSRRGFTLRAIHNAWLLKHMIEKKKPNPKWAAHLKGLHAPLEVETPSL